MGEEESPNKIKLILYVKIIAYTNHFVNAHNLAILMVNKKVTEAVL